ncbi:MAG TPA: L-ribulose-5-phosphate 4-epimerase [Bacteroidetes bacterium]|nr:L-ribulose-5-phosphate 4-epimerase [Bacteroidota bacterium]
MKELKEMVWKSNLDLMRSGLVVLTWGNVSGFDPERHLMVIKPSGVDYELMKPRDMVVVDMEGKTVEGKLRPSSDTPTHLELYRRLGGLGGIVHTHSRYAVSWAQAGKDIPAMGTTHADHFYGSIPCTRKLTQEEVEKDYELNTGRVIVDRFRDLDPRAVPGVIVNDHGPFAWGKDPEDAVKNAIVLEEVAAMAFNTVLLGAGDPVEQYLLDKHYFRKHGKDAYYGQNED